MLTNEMGDHCSIPDRIKGVTLHHYTLTAPEDHPAICPMIAGNSFPRDKEKGHEMPNHLAPVQRD